MQWEGGVFQFLWMEWITAISLYALVLLVWYMMLKDVNDGLTPEKEAFFQALGFVTGRFQAALSLMLGFYTSTIYNRWWKVRDIEGVVIGRINDLAVQIAALVRDQPMGDSKEGGEQMKRIVSNASLAAAKTSVLNADESNELDRSIGSLEGTGATSAGEVRMNLVRWLNLVHAVAIGELYEKKPNGKRRVCLSDAASLYDIYASLAQSLYPMIQNSPHWTMLWTLVS